MLFEIGRTGVPTTIDLPVPPVDLPVLATGVTLYGRIVDPEDTDNPFDPFRLRLVRASHPVNLADPGADRVVIPKPPTPAPPGPLPPGIPVTISADVEWFLVLRPQARLALRAFDQDGILLGSSDFKEDVTRDAPGSQTFTIPNLTIPPEVTSVVVKAVLIDPWCKTFSARATSSSTTSAAMTC